MDNDEKIEKYVFDMMNKSGQLVDQLVSMLSGKSDLVSESFFWKCNVSTMHSAKPIQF